MLGDLGKLIVAKVFKKLPKVQKIARSGHTAYLQHCNSIGFAYEKSSIVPYVSSWFRVSLRNVFWLLHEARKIELWTSVANLINILRS